MDCNAKTRAAEMKNTIAYVALCLLLAALCLHQYVWAQPQASRLKQLWSLPEPAPPSSLHETTTSGEVHEAWVRYYGSGLARSLDDATAIATDTAGNIYVTGSSSNPIASLDFLTIKYEPQGNEVWRRSYSGEPYDDDEAKALVVDAARNVYVTGRSRVKKTSWDYATVKYDAEGVQQWAARYDGGLQGEDGAIALAVDSLGNVYVTGYSYGARQNFDYATIKYDRAGNEQWVRRYDGPQNSKDVPVALALGYANANCVVTVTGASGIKNSSAGYTYDYATVQYDCDGRERWQARYDLAQRDDKAAALVADGQGNVYVTGTGIDSSRNSSYNTIKYDANGVAQWLALEKFYSQFVVALALDQHDNVYVTGAIGGGGRLVKYNRDGKRLWTASYDAGLSSRNGIDLCPNAMKVDAVGNAFIAGFSTVVDCGPDECSEFYVYFTIKIDFGGDLQWVTGYGNEGGYSMAQALTLDAAGNVCVTGFSNGDYLTLKYNAEGVEQWQKRTGGTGSSSDKAKALSVDQEGNVYILALSERANGYGDYLTLKYDREGHEIWQARFGDIHESKVPVALAIDDSGNAYVTGQSISHRAGQTIKYDSAGRQQWLVYFSVDGHAGITPAALALDRAGNVYVTGSSQTSNRVDAHFDYATVKYNAAGVQQWVATYNSATNGREYAYALAVDLLGNVYVTGRSWTGGLSEDIATVKYNSSGAQQWVKRYSRANKPIGYPAALALDRLGDVYIAGYIEDGNRSADYVTIKYTGAGEEQWVAHYNGTRTPNGESNDRAVALAIDAARNVYLTGTSNATGSGYDIATIKYNHAGVQEWVARYNAPANLTESAYDLALDSLGNVYVTGTGSLDADIVTLKYNPSGEQQWLAQFTGISGGRDFPRSLKLDRFGNVYVVSNSVGVAWNVFTLIKYEQAGTSLVGETPSAAPLAYALAQNHPNPFNPSTTIRYALAKPSRVTLKIYNLAGQEVATLVDDDKITGEHEIKWTPANLASGVYIYRLHAGDFVETKKLVLLQ